MISSIRDYIKARIKSFNSDYQEIDDPVGDDDLATTRLNRAFKVIFGTDTTFYTGNTYGDDVNLSVELYAKAGVSVNKVFDELYQDAISIKNLIIDPTISRNLNFLTEIVSGTISISPLNTNDKTFKATITFNARLDFTYC